jgi:hypothetical protein
MIAHQDREAWLNGWPRNGTCVFVHGNLHCAGCGNHIGSPGYPYPKGFVVPDRDPDWPFNPDSCPICEPEEFRGKMPPVVAKIADASYLLGLQRGREGHDA